MCDLTKSLTPKQKQVLEYLKRNPTHGRIKVSRALNICDKMASVRLKVLRARGLITTPKPSNQNGGVHAP